MTKYFERFWHLFRKVKSHKNDLMQVHHGPTVVKVGWWHQHLWRRPHSARWRVFALLNDFTLQDRFCSEFFFGGMGFIYIYIYICIFKNPICSFGCSFYWFVPLSSSCSVFEQLPSKAPRGVLVLQKQWTHGMKRYVGEEKYGQIPFEAPREISITLITQKHQEPQDFRNKNQCLYPPEV